MCTNDANSPGNYGMWDQVRALEFVKENIRNFRGNPGIITIFGQNTGAASVGLQILSPRTVSKLREADTYHIIFKRIYLFSVNNFANLLQCMSYIRIFNCQTTLN